MHKGASYVLTTRGSKYLLMKTRKDSIRAVSELCNLNDPQVLAAFLAFDAAILGIIRREELKGYIESIVSELTLKGI
ncbi:MAG: hypothetical protein DRJ52_11435 [Thermoprotei archaeon]|nr:MAG: hypothetical protein DRJ52_11435 [Thermoprotei archaeon]